MRFVLIAFCLVFMSTAQAGIISSVDDFSGVQGGGGWSYVMQYGGDGSFGDYISGLAVELSFDGNVWTDGDNAIGADYNLNGPGSGYLMRRWTSSMTGDIEMDAMFGNNLGGSGSLLYAIAIDDSVREFGELNTGEFFDYSFTWSVNPGSFVDFVSFSNVVDSLESSFQATGAFTQSGTTAVPEPGSLLLTSLAAVGFAFCKWKGIVK